PQRVVDGPDRHPYDVTVLEEGPAEPSRIPANHQGHPGSKLPLDRGQEMRDGEGNAVEGQRPIRADFVDLGREPAPRRRAHGVHRLERPRLLGEMSTTADSSTSARRTTNGSAAAAIDARV